MARYFGTNGVRGTFDQLTPELTLQLTQAIGSYFVKESSSKGGQQCRIIVGRDCRLTGEILSSCVCAGLASVGCDVINLGVATSPTIEFMVKKLGANAGVIVSASHNPPEWNALKVVSGNGLAVSREKGEKIEAFLGKRNLAVWDKVGKITKYQAATQEHINAIFGLVEAQKIRQRRPKLVIDCGNGAAALIAPRLLRDLGCVVVEMNGQMDGRFPGRPSEPTEKNVAGLIELVQAERADAGIAWDGDGDRIVFVDEKGNYVIGDKVCALSILWKNWKMKEAEGPMPPAGTVVTTVATSKAVEDVAKSCGLKTTYTAIGAPYLSEAVLKTNAVLGGEEVGGVIWPELSLAKDGILTAAKLAEAICEKPLSSWLAAVPVYHNVKLKLTADSKQKKTFVVRVLAHAKKKKLNPIVVDGVRINFENSWVIVRASGTENYARIFAEAKTVDEAMKLAKEYEKLAKG